MHLASEFPTISFCPFIPLNREMPTANVGGDTKNKWAQKPREYKFKMRSKTSNYIL